MSIVLSDRQRQAVEHVRGPMLVVAGAGTGKTTVLVERIARLVEDGHAAPGEILAITYTRNAARELQERVAARLRQPLPELNAGTFHSWCFDLLARRRARFKVIDNTDLWIYLRRAIEQNRLPLRHFIRAASPGQFLSDLLKFFDRCHDELVDFPDYERYVAEVDAGAKPLPRVAKSGDTLSREDVVARCREIAAVFRTAEEMLAADGLGTFGHMILRAVKLLRRKPAVLAEERARLRFVLIDEFQDANLGQIELASLLVGDQRNLFAVGDPDQAIYQFRGASSAAFSEFRRRFPDTDVVNLVENRRSTSPVLAASFACISQNPAPQFLERQQLLSARESQARERGAPMRPGPVEIVLSADRDTEAADIAETIAEQRRQLRCECRDARHASGWCNFAVLYRLHNHRDQVIRELAERSIPFVVVGQDVLDTREVRDALAVLRAIASPSDSVSVLRVAAFRPFRIAPEALRGALATQPRGGTVAQALERVPGGPEVLTMLAAARERARARNMPARAALEDAVRWFGLPDSEPLAVLREHIAAWEQKPITTSRSAADFLEYLDWFVESGAKMTAGGDEEETAPAEAPDAVRLMTVHAAKGLEFNRVFVIRLNSPSFPASFRETLFDFPQELRQYAVEEGSVKARQQQEERRLLYVAMTRARDGLTLTAKPGRGQRDPSPPGFLRDILKNREVAAMLATRQARPYSVELAAAASESATPLAGWIELPPLPTLAQAPLSASSIDSYQRCPLRFKLERDWKLPRETPAALRFGAAVHSALKAHFDAVRAGRPLDSDALVAVFRAELEKEAIDNALQAELYARQGERQLRAFLEAQAQRPVPRVVATETSFTIDIEGAKVNGRMDRVDAGADGVTIVDYKTGSPREQKDADQSLQLSIYAIAAQLAGTPAAKLVFYNVETNTAIETTRTAEELQVAAQQVRSVADGIAAGAFDPRPDRHCSGCGYRTVCPATEQKFHSIAAAAAVQ